MSLPIIVAPVDPECRLTKEECDALNEQLQCMANGDAVVFPVPVELFVRLPDGMWANVDDMAELFSKDEDGGKPEKDYPEESTYIPPGVKSHLNDEDD